MFSFQSKPSARPTFEDIFFKHHGQLYEWAMQLTGGNHSDAEDLMQELFIRVAEAGSVGEHIENAGDYLFAILRNLHYARIRRARTSAIDDLSILDYDSAEWSLRAVDRNGILFIREDLHRVCDYLCERKESSRAASISFASVPNAHSIALLPHNLVAVASSTAPTGNKLVLFDRAHPDVPVFSLPLEAAHGVVWDAQRNVLWALGDKQLLKLTVNDSGKTLEITKRYAIEEGGGHDLVMRNDGNSLVATTSKKVLVFDIGAETLSIYKPLQGIRDVKSVSFHPVSGRMAYTVADPKVWWTYTVHFLDPKSTLPLEGETYKVRWAAANHS